MHRVDRGPEPFVLKGIRDVYTPRWVDYYIKGIGTKPTDSLWRRFHYDLCQVFSGICGYCEENAKGEVDHFRPKSRFPNLVYCWTNWIFSCHECNHAKSSKWPVGGYVDPCATHKLDRPECHFIFDTRTGMISPSQDLKPDRRQRARRTIDDLRLNDSHHLKKRVEWLELFSALISADPDASSASISEIILHFTSPNRRFSSLLRAWLSEMGYDIEFLKDPQSAEE